MMEDLRIQGFERTVHKPLVSTWYVTGVRYVQILKSSPPQILIKSNQILIFSTFRVAIPFAEETRIR